MSLFKRKSKDTGNDVYAFISGNTIPITEVNDPVFSAKTLGDGLAIIPSGGTYLCTLRRNYLYGCRRVKSCGRHDISKRS